MPIPGLSRIYRSERRAEIAGLGLTSILAGTPAIPSSVRLPAVTVPDTDRAGVRRQGPPQTAT